MMPSNNPVQICGSGIHFMVKVLCTEKISFTKC